MRRIMFFSIITFFILMTSCSLEEWKLQNIEVDRVKRLVSDLQYSKNKLKPGDEQYVRFIRYTTKPDPITKKGPEFNYDSVFTVNFEGTLIEFEKISKDSIKFWIPGPKKKKKDPCSDEFLRPGLKKQIHEICDDLETGKSKDHLTRLLPVRCTDSLYQKIMVEEASNLGVLLEFTGTEENDDGKMQDVFNISRPKKK